MAKKPSLHLMSLDELKGHAKDVEKAIVKAEREQVKKARAAAEQVVKKFGVSLDHLLGSEKKTPKTSAKAKTVSAPKFKNPENPKQTWTGKGRQPGWYKAAIEAGKKPEDLAI